MISISTGTLAIITRRPLVVGLRRGTCKVRRVLRAKPGHKEIPEKLVLLAQQVRREILALRDQQVIPAPPVQLGQLAIPATLATPVHPDPGLPAQRG